MKEHREDQLMML
jgi:hypothetical protein